MQSNKIVKSETVDRKIGVNYLDDTRENNLTDETACLGRIL